MTQDNATDKRLANLVNWDQRPNHKELAAKGGRRSGETRRRKAEERKRNLLAQRIILSLSTEDLEKIANEYRNRKKGELIAFLLGLD